MNTYKYVLVVQVLALANSVGDLVANLAMAKAGVCTWEGGGGGGGGAG